MAEAWAKRVTGDEPQGTMGRVQKRETSGYEADVFLRLLMTSIIMEIILPHQAPSASLCVSILDLHSDTRACGKLILDLCNSLSQKLVPVAPGVRNEELDHNLVIRYVLTIAEGN